MNAKDEIFTNGKAYAHQNEQVKDKRRVQFESLFSEFFYIALIGLPEVKQIKIYLLVNRTTLVFIFSFLNNHRIESINKYCLTKQHS